MSGTNLFFASENVPNLQIALTDISGKVVLAECQGTPPTTANKFQVGCRMIQTDGSGSNVVYFNTGTVASPSWTALGAIPPGDIPLASQSVLIGNASNVASAVTPSAIGLGLMRMAHATYSFAVDGGASCTPASTAVIPANAIIIGGTINSTTAVTASGSATFAVGTTAGSSSTSILGATAKASLSTDALINSAATLASPVKMSASGSINVTIATGPLTAGIVEIFVFYYVATNS